MTLSDEIQVLHIDSGDKTDTLQKQWPEWVEEPARKARADHKLLACIGAEASDRHIAVVVSELVERHWFQFLLHNQKAQVIKALLLFEWDQRIVVVNVPWYMKV